MIPGKAIKKFNRPIYREIVASHLLAYGFFPSTDDGIYQAKKFVEGLNEWVAPSNLPEYYDGIDTDLLIGRDTPGIQAIRETLRNFYFETPTTSINETPIEEIPVEVEITEVEVISQPTSDPEPEPVKIEVEVPVEREKRAPRRIKLPRTKNRFVRKKAKPLSQRMAESFDRNLLDPLIDEIKNPKTPPSSKQKTTKTAAKKQVSKKILPPKSPNISAKFSSGGGDLVDRAFSKIRSSFGAAAAARKAFKESGGDPRSVRRGYFLSKALGTEFGGDFRRRVRGTFSRDPDATQDPGLTKEQRFAEVVKRDLANRPQMVKQPDLFPQDPYTDKTALQSITDLAKKTADKILGLEPGFVRIEKSQKETSNAFTKITQNLTEVKNTFVKTSDNFKEFVDNKEEVIKIKAKIKEILRKEQDENKREDAEKQLEMFNDVAGVSNVKETDQGIEDEEQPGRDGDKGGGGLSDFLDFARRPRLGARFRLLRRKISGFGRGIRGRFSGLGKRISGFGSGIRGRFSGLGRGIGGRLGGLGSGLKGLRGVGGRFFGPVLGDMLFPEGAGVTEPQMGPDGKFRTPDGKLVPEPGSAAAPKPKPKSVATRVGDIAESGKGLIGKGKGAIGKVAGKVGSKLGGGVLKSIGKKIPGVGLVIGGLAAADRIKSGDILGGIGEIGSGIASLVPGVGTAISLGIDALLMGKDIAAEASKPEAPVKLSSGGIVAGEAGNEAVIPLSASPAKKAVKNLKDSSSGSLVGAIGPILSATAGVVRNPLYGSILGSTINPILKPLMSKYKVPVYSGEFGQFKIGKLKAAATQAKGKAESIEKAGDNPLTAAFGWLGNMFKGIGNAVGGAVSGIGGFFSRLFGRGRGGGTRNRGPVTGGTPGAWGPILDVIKAAEMGRGGYESMNPSTSLPGATNMTIGEVNRQATGAVGAYQFMPRKTLPAAMRGAGLKETDLFSPANQDKMAVWLIEHRGVTPQMIKDNPDEAMIRLGMEWAGLPMPIAMQGHSRRVNAGQSYYAGDGRNAATVSIEQVREAFGKLGAAREEERVNQVNPQSRGKQGPTAPGAVGDQAQASASNIPTRTPVAETSQKIASYKPSDSVIQKPESQTSMPDSKIEPSDSSLIASIKLPYIGSYMAPSVEEDPEPEDYKNNTIAVIVQIPSSPQNTSGNLNQSEMSISQEKGITIRDLFHARLSQA